MLYFIFTSSYDIVQPLSFGSPVLEPELDVFLLQLGELLPIGEFIELISVSSYQAMRGMGIKVKPLFQPRNLRHWVYEGAVSLAFFRIHQ